FYFFFQAEDGIRDRNVTGVQTCALPISLPLDGAELDAIYELPYMRTWHPCYADQGGVPAIQEVEFSITHNRGCFGGCNFCAIARSEERRVGKECGWWGWGGSEKQGVGER